MHGNRRLVAGPDTHGGEVKYNVCVEQSGTLAALRTWHGFRLHLKHILSFLPPTIASLWRFTGDVCIHQPNTEEPLRPISSCVLRAKLESDQHTDVLAKPEHAKRRLPFPLAALHKKEHAQVDKSLDTRFQNRLVVLRSTLLLSETFKRPTWCAFY